MGGAFQRMVRVSVREQSSEIEAELHEGSRSLAEDVVEAWEALVLASDESGA